MLLDREQLDYARKVFAREAHCPRLECDCAACIAGQALIVYGKFLTLLERHERRELPREFGDETWLVRIRETLDRKV